MLCIKVLAQCLFTVMSTWPGRNLLLCECEYSGWLYKKKVHAYNLKQFDIKSFKNRTNFPSLGRPVRVTKYFDYILFSFFKSCKFCVVFLSTLATGDTARNLPVFWLTIKLAYLQNNFWGWNNGKMIHIKFEWLVKWHNKKSSLERKKTTVKCYQYYLLTPSQLTLV